MAPANIAKTAWSFKERGRTASLIGVTVTQNNEAPVTVVINARLNMGSMKRMLGAGWNILAGGACRGDQVTFNISRTL